MALSTLPMDITRSIYAAINNGETGGTYSVDGKAVPTAGYIVGGVVPSLINPTPAQIKDFVETAPTDYVGFWEDSATLALYVDAVDIVRTPEAAERLSKLRGEIAYFDVANGSEVRV